MQLYSCTQKVKFPPSLQQETHSQIELERSSFAVSSTHYQVIRDVGLFTPPLPITPPAATTNAGRTFPRTVQTPRGQEQQPRDMGQSVCHCTAPAGSPRLTLSAISHMMERLISPAEHKHEYRVCLTGGIHISETRWQEHSYLGSLGKARCLTTNKLTISRGIYTSP